MRHQTSQFTLGGTAPFMELGESERKSERKLGVGGEAKRGAVRRTLLHTSSFCFACQSSPACKKPERTLNFAGFHDESLRADCLSAG